MGSDSSDWINLRPKPVLTQHAVRLALLAVSLGVIFDIFIPIHKYTIY